MRFLPILLLLILFTSILSAGNNDEFRAVWVITWEHISSGSTPEQNKARIRKILDDVVAANMNAVLWQARQGGTAYYNSSYEPWGYYAGGSYPGYDPLAYAIEEGHKRGIEVHAWFNVFQASSTVAGAPAAEHPEWICRDQNGIPMSSSIALSPGMDACRDYTIDVAMEIVRNYDIDGFHLDYVRWNEYSNSKTSQDFAKTAEQEGYLDGMIPPHIWEDMEYNKAGRYLYDVDHPYSAGVPSGFGSWEEWWRSRVTLFVQTLHDSIQAVKPWVRLSPAALGKYNWSGWQGYGSVYQDAALWFNQGYIDQLTPMHYHWTTASGFYGMLEGNCPECWSQHIQQGISDGRLFTVGPGSYVFASNNVWGRHPSVINEVRTVNWTDGFQFFSYGSWEDYLYFEEAGNTFFANKTKIRDTKLIVSADPDAPTIGLVKLDSLNYEITVTPPVSITDNQRYAIYRSEDNIIDPDNDTIIDIHFGNSAYTVTDQFSGYQIFNGTYYYAATTLDRYWNESVPSGTAQTDPIPSLPPEISGLTPALPDTININADITIDFTKEMNTGSVESAISFNPAVAIAQYNWSVDLKTVTLQKAENFQFATDYTFTIAATATDANGVQLDGNGDGTPGDGFQVTFRTKDVDDAGPVLTFSHPDFNMAIDSFGVREILTFNFDEDLDESSVADTSFVLYSGNDPVSTDNKISNSQFTTSLVSMGSYEDLEPDTEYRVEISRFVADTLGNQLSQPIEINFRTSMEHYIDETLIDEFIGNGDWRAPDYSGSTVGIVGSGCVFGYSTTRYLPGSATAPIYKKSAFLKYQWMQSSDNGYLLREYLAGGAPRDVVFDSTWTLECYVYGDNSKNKFRFAVDEGSGGNWPSHEVSKWHTIDWYGWKLIRWKLSDPNSVGSWIGNGVMDSDNYRIDSFQLTHDTTSGSLTGRIYFDNLRVVKTSTDLTPIGQPPVQYPKKLALSQNYPNPFNPSTEILFAIRETGPVSLKVYDMLGRQVAVLVDEIMPAGEYKVKFTAAQFASGTYFYILNASGESLKRKMILLK